MTQANNCGFRYILDIIRSGWWKMKTISAQQGTKICLQTKVKKGTSGINLIKVQFKSQKNRFAK